MVGKQLACVPVSIQAQYRKTKTLGCRPLGLASEATLQDTLTAFIASIRGPYSCAFAVVFSLSTVIGVPASPA
jgi:hypothetical protein